MKKLGVLFIILFLSMSLASAGFWGYGFGFLITGNVVAEENAGILEGEEIPIEEQPIEEIPMEEQPIEEIPTEEQQPTEEIPMEEQPIEEIPTEEQQPTEENVQQQYEERKQEFYQGNQPQVGSGDYNQQLYGEDWCANGMCCPDGICDDFEKSTTGCPIDCQAELAQKFNNYMPSKQKLGSCLSEEVANIISKKCESKGGSATKIYDENKACSKVHCSFNINRGIFVSDVCLTEAESEQQSQLCREMGLDTIVIPGKKDCAARIQCKNEGSSIGYGLSQEDYQNGKDNFEQGNLDPATVLEIILKLDSTKMKISDIQAKMLSVADYYDSKGNTERAEAYRQSSSKMDDLNSKIDERKEELKIAVESGTLDWNTIFRIKTELRYSVDGPLNDAMGILLGVDNPHIGGEAIDCGEDGICFEDYLRNCEKDATFNPEENVEMKIVDIDEKGNCELYLSTPSGEGSCNVPDYSYATLSQEELMPYCDENFQEISEQYNEEQALQEEIISEEIIEEVEPNQMGGKEFFCDVSETCDCNEVCDEKFEDIYACDDCIRFVQCGDGLCEPLAGEDDLNNENYCSRDCNTPENEDIWEINNDID
ncbi:MAG: hypothetical protein QT08_C0022G0019 [archaeon GW2011_AR17]|nr:MAG: hypothetical protein QT08_C0022G0019 [archaeon GW2011_AR17]MBS3154560.1 hypothetical protein [Candidatus Woesearchaeota archaeon]HIH59515.1 hypothetical protein [Nanoarchaeota archaeon]HII14118.1 hypothetical protein [Nanoarchaeota archaeon]